MHSRGRLRAARVRTDKEGLCHRAPTVRCGAGGVKGVTARRVASFQRKGTNARPHVPPHPTPPARRPLFPDAACAALPPQLNSSHDPTRDDGRHGWKRPPLLILAAPRRVTYGRAARVTWRAPKRRDEPEVSAERIEPNFSFRSPQHII